MSKPKLKIGFLSCINYGNQGYREGLLHLAKRKFEQEGVSIIVLDGGLIDFKTLNTMLRRKLHGLKNSAKDQARMEFIYQAASDLSLVIPMIPKVNVFIVTSPAYDGHLGQEIAQELLSMRKDIRLYKPGNDRMHLKQVGQILGIYATKKQSWRSDYYDTPVLRALKDEVKRTTRGLGDTNVVGCLASSVHHPGDSSPILQPYATLPAIYKIDETRTSENQIGIRILTFTKDNAQEASWKTYNFKDLVSEEWAFVKAPPKSSKIQQTIIATIRKRGPLTCGQLAGFMDCSESNIQRSLNGLIKRRMSKYWPGLFHDKSSNRYEFRMEWFQKKLRYDQPTTTHVNRFLGFACLHAACKHTDMRYFRDEVPKIIVENDIGYLLGVGDFIEGLKHNLLLRGEVYGSREHASNYDWQESLAAYLCGSVIVKVFKHRFTVNFEANKSKALNIQALTEMVKSSFIKFLFIPGNHCEWTTEQGFSALSIFTRDLEKFIIMESGKYLNELGIFIPELEKIVKENLVMLNEGEYYNLNDSGLKTALLHPKMGRAITLSIRLQGMLAMAKNAHIVFGGNFHTAENMEEWMYKLGQRICMLFGTLKTGSGFERGKLKTVDHGVGMLTVESANGRIQTSESTFFGKKREWEELQTDNMSILDDFENWFRSK